jgi:hypothetical protein
MARTRNRYRTEYLKPEDKEGVLLAFGRARSEALRYERSLALDDAHRAHGKQRREAIDAVAFELTGDRNFYLEIGTTVSGYMKLLDALRARDSNAA